MPAGLYAEWLCPRSVSCKIPLNLQSANCRAAVMMWAGTELGCPSLVLLQIAGSEAELRGQLLNLHGRRQPRIVRRTS